MHFSAVICALRSASPTLVRSFYMMGSPHTHMSPKLLLLLKIQHCTEVQVPTVHTNSVGHLALPSAHVHVRSAFPHAHEPLTGGISTSAP
jgi:hypothetical protein